MENISNKKNIIWINTVKALSMIFIYFVHCQLYYGLLFSGLNQFIYPFYVNVFFFISGYLLFSKELSSPKIEQNRKKYLYLV